MKNWKSLVALLATSAAVAAFSAACGPVKGDCSAATCTTGCCDDEGVCQIGVLDSACGVSGMACQTCTAGLYCQSGQCVGFGNQTQNDGGNGDGGMGDGGSNQDGGQCKSIGGSCLFASECCSSFCDSTGQCATSQNTDGGQCLGNGQACAASGQCCSSYCNPVGTCATPNDGGSMCKSNGAACFAANECCSAFCAENGQCATPGSDAGSDGGTDGGKDGGDVFPDGGFCANPCVAQGSAQSASCGSCQASVCAQDSFCCTNQWDGACANLATQICSQCAGDGGTDGGKPDSGVDAGPVCYPTGFPCTSAFECCSFSCNAFGVCDAPATDAGTGSLCKGLGTTCTTSSQCCSAYCSAGSCQANPNGGAVACGAVTDICISWTTYASPQSCDPCVNQICALDPYCCGQDPNSSGDKWDSACVNAVPTNCPGRCAP